jgi:hypothetical protein
VPGFRLAAQYADMERDSLLELLDALLDERESFSTQIASLTVEVSVQRVSGWNSGYEWGWRDCTRNVRKDGGEEDPGVQPALELP